MDPNKSYASLFNNRGDLRTTIKQAMDWCGIFDRISNSTRISIKPNLTYPYYKAGVTTSPEVLYELVRILKEYTDHIAICETDGGYGAWKAEKAFEGHHLYKIQDKFDVKIVNLCKEDSELITFNSRLRSHQIPLPVRLLHHTDLFISVPVPKIHAMTGLTLSYKNQWGCVPDVMRLRRHYIFNDAIVAINKALKPIVLSDGTYFLDQNGPMDGVPVRMDLVICATDCGTFDRYVSELMGFPWQRVKHLQRAAALGDMPSSIDTINFNVSPQEARTHVFQLKRTLRNWIALSGFNSRFLTWLGYESWFGRIILHGLLYAISGKMVKPQEQSRSNHSLTK